MYISVKRDPLRRMSSSPRAATGFRDRRDSSDVHARPYIDASAAAIGIAADALWDAEQQCVMHGAVAWRNALAGWRGPYSLASLGHHDRMRQQVRHWVKRQNTKPIADSPSPVTGPFDAGTHLTRKEARCTRMETSPRITTT